MINSAEVLVFIVGVLGAIGALIGAISAWRTARGAARRADVDVLAETVKLLAAENVRLRTCIEHLEGERQQDRERIESLEQALAATRHELDLAWGRIAELERERVQFLAAQESRLGGGRKPRRVDAFKEE
jgi:chromosome segregation ATPase